MIQCKTRAHEGEVKEGYDSYNSPEAFDVKLAQFDKLPLSGAMPRDREPWSSSYWPTSMGGVAVRWLDPKAPAQVRVSNQIGRYQFLTAEQVKSMSKERLNKLSPAEKYDIYMGHYDFPLTKAEWQFTQESLEADGSVPYWYGICHGWSAAAINELQPGAQAVMTNPDGVEVTFYRADIEALLSDVYAKFHWNRDSRITAEPDSTTVLGTRCESELRFDAKGRVVQSACRDVNPGALHLVLASHLGNPNEGKRHSFVVDISRNSEVWNQPVVGYNSKVVSKRAFDPKNDHRAQHRADGTESIVVVATDLIYLGELEPSLVDPAVTRNDARFFIRLLYELELDRDGVIIGGEWLDHPENKESVSLDFMWKSSKLPTNFDNLINYQAVKRIADQSRKGR
jgi:hypothetical protein